MKNVRRVLEAHIHADALPYICDALGLCVKMRLIVCELIKVVDLEQWPDLDLI